MTGVYVLGAGGHAKVVVATLRASGCPLVGVLDDAARDGVLGVPILGVLDALPIDASAVIAIGDNLVRAELAARFPSARWRSAVHPAAWVADDVALGPGSVIFAGAVVQPGAHVGAHVIVNTGASVDHDAVVDDFAHVAPGARLAGGARVGSGAFVGMGSVVLPNVAVGAWARVGAGAVVTRDVPDGATVVGVPARVRREAT